MNKNYRGWKLEFADGVYTATKKGFVALKANSRIGVERLIDAREFVEWREKGCATIKKANDFIQKLKQLTCEKAETN